MNIKKELIYADLKPPKLMRIEISEKCNLNCVFCCWKRPYQPDDQTSVSSPICLENIKFIIDIMKELDCKSFHLTGGEPLMIDTKTLLDLISILSSDKEVKQFWITSNGTLLNINLIKKMHQAGLRNMVISLGAETNEKFQDYTKNLDLLH